MRAGEPLLWWGTLAFALASLTAISALEQRSSVPVLGPFSTFAYKHFYFDVSTSTSFLCNATMSSGGAIGYAAVPVPDECSRCSTKLNAVAAPAKHLRDHVMSSGMLATPQELSYFNAVNCPTCNLPFKKNQNGTPRQHSPCVAPAHPPVNLSLSQDLGDADGDAPPSQPQPQPAAQAEAQAQPDEPVPMPSFNAKDPAFIHIANNLQNVLDSIEENDNNKTETFLHIFMTQSLANIYKPPIISKNRLDDSFGPNPEPAPGVGFLSNIYNRCRKALGELRDRQVGRAMRALRSLGCSDVSLPAVRANIESKYPERKPGAMNLQCPNISAADVPNLPLEHIKATLFDKARLTAPGLSKWSFGDIQATWRAAEKPGCHPSLAAFPQNITKLSNLIVQGYFNNSNKNRILFTNLRGVPIAKDKQHVDSRPIGIADAFLELATTSLLRTKAVQDLIEKVISSLDFCMGTPGGSEAAAHALRALLASNPNFIGINLDIWNAFNSIDRQLILNLIHDMPELGPIIDMLYGHGPTLVDFSDKGTKFELMQKVGVAQGESLSMLLFAAAFSKILRHTEAQIPANTYMYRFADGVIIAGLPEPAFTLADKAKSSLTSSSSGMRLSPAKCEVLIRSSVSAVHAAVALGKAAARNFKVKNGTVICGSPVGDNSFCSDFMKETVDAAIGKINEIVTLATSSTSSTSNTIQAGQLLLRYCICPAQLTFASRTTPPSITIPELKRFDEHFASAFLRIINITPLDLNEDQMKNFRQRLALDLCNGGAGFPLMTLLAKKAYIGSIALTANVVKRVTGNLDPLQLFPEADAIIKHNIFDGIDKFKNFSIHNFYDNSFRHVQQTLSQHGREQRLKDALASTADLQQRALILSAADPKAAAWLTCVYGREDTLKLNNEEMTTSLLYHLGLNVSTTITSYGSRRCLACSPLPKPGQPDVAHPVTIKNDTGVHAASCLGGGKGSSAGARNSRHNLVSLAIENSVFRQNASMPDGQHHITHEPPVSDHGESKLAAAETARNRADFSVTNPNNTITLFDTSIAFPGISTYHNAHLLANAGIAADTRHKDKLKFYDQRWKLKDNVKLVPLIFETGGRWHEDTKHVIKRHLKAAHPNNIPQYVYNLKATTQRIAVALRRTTVKGIIALNRRLASYPLVHGAAGGAGAGAGAGAGGGPAA